MCQEVNMHERKDLRERVAKVKGTETMRLSFSRKKQAHLQFMLTFPY